MCAAALEGRRHYYNMGARLLVGVLVLLAVPFATTRRRAMDVLVARVDATRDEAARQAAIDAGGAARDAYRANDFCDAVPATKTPHTLRVASLNLWQPAADTWPRRRAALARLLRDADVDVVALQEARGEPRWVDELREACAAEGLEFPHSRYVPGTGGGAGGAAPPGLSLIHISEPTRPY